MRKLHVHNSLFPSVTFNSFVEVHVLIPDRTKSYLYGYQQILTDAFEKVKMLIEKKQRLDTYKTTEVLEGYDAERKTKFLSKKIYFNSNKPINSVITWNK